MDICNKAKSPLTGEKVHVVAAGAMYNGKSLAAALAYGAEAVWVGTRFVAASEAGAPKGHQDAVVTADYTDTLRTIIFTGRPLRVRKNDYIERLVMFLLGVHEGNLIWLVGNRNLKRYRNL